MLVERASPDLVAVDCVDEGHASGVAGVLVELERRQALAFETGGS